MNKLTALKKTAIFGRLTTGELTTVAKSCIEHQLKKGQTLFNAGDESRGLYIITKGSLRAFRTNSGGREQTIHVEKAGSSIAEIPVFDDQPYPSSVAAEEDSEVLFLSKADMKKLCLKYPVIALSALKMLASRLRKTAALVESISLKEVDQRLAAFLLEEFEGEAGGKVNLPSNAAIASRLGSVREVVSRAFAKLEEKGFISLDDRHNASLLDGEGLKRYAGK